MWFIPLRLNIAILKRPQYQDCNQPLSLFIFENIIIIFFVVDVLGIPVTTKDYVYTALAE